MIITLTDTTTAKISSSLLRARRNAGGPASGMVLTLLVVCDAKEYESALKAAMESGREHPARILLMVRASGRVATLDAEVRIGEGTPGEVIVIRMRGALAEHPASVVRPLLLPDSPVVIWWPGRAPADTADDELAGLAVRRVTDAAAAKRPLSELKTRAATYQPGDTDLSWTRLTRWRALLAAALDQYPARVTAVRVEGERNSPSADLLGAWLQSCLDLKVSHKVTGGPGMTAVRMTTAGGDIAITRADGLLASYAVPGQPERLVALKRRETTELMSEELRRLDDDEVYADVLKSLLNGSAETSAAGSGAGQPVEEETSSPQPSADASERPAAGESTAKTTARRTRKAPAKTATGKTTASSKTSSRTSKTASGRQPATKKAAPTKATAAKATAAKATARTTTTKRAATRPPANGED